jgi:hypothetical protein
MLLCHGEDFKSSSNYNTCSILAGAKGHLSSRRRVHVLFRMFGSSVPLVVCRRVHVLFRMFGSSLPPVVCGRVHVLFRGKDEPNILNKT